MTFDLFNYCREWQDMCFSLCVNVPVSLRRSVPPCVGGGTGWGSGHMVTGPLLYAFRIDDPLCVSEDDGGRPSTSFLCLL